MLPSCYKVLFIKHMGLINSLEPRRVEVRNKSKEVGSFGEIKEKAATYGYYTSTGNVGWSNCEPNKN